MYVCLGPLAIRAVLPPVGALAVEAAAGRRVLRVEHISSFGRVGLPPVGETGTAGDQVALPVLQACRVADLAARGRVLGDGHAASHSERQPLLDMDGCGRVMP